MIKEIVGKRRPAKVALIDSGIETRKSDLGQYITLYSGFTIKDGYIV